MKSVHSHIYTYKIHPSTHKHAHPPTHPPPHTHTNTHTHTHSFPVLSPWPYILQTQPRCTDLTQIFHNVELRLNSHKIKTTLFSKFLTPFPDPIQIPNIFVPRASVVRFLCLVLQPTPLFTRHLHTAVRQPQAYSVTFAPASSQTHGSKCPTC
jgi:hypothetical protein